MARVCLRALLVMHGQRAKVDFVIHTLPCIRFTAAVNDACFNFKLREGLSAETSGGLLAMCVMPLFVPVVAVDVTPFAFCPRPLRPPSARRCKKWTVGLLMSSATSLRALASPASCEPLARRFCNTCDS